MFLKELPSASLDLIQNYLNCNAPKESLFHLSHPPNLTFSMRELTLFAQIIPLLPKENIREFIRKPDSALKYPKSFRPKKLLLMEFFVSLSAINPQAMQKKEYQSPKSFRFRRWSRKGYSVFCSIGKCVTIGNLRKNAIEASLRKKPGLHRIPLVAEQNACEESIPDAGSKDRCPAALPTGNMPGMCLFSLPETAGEPSSHNRNDIISVRGIYIIYVCFPAFL